MVNQYSVEARVVEPRFAPLFTEAEVAEAARHLRELNASVAARVVEREPAPEGDELTTA